MDEKKVEKPQSLVHSGTALSILTFVSRVLGLMREMTKSAFMGTGPMADAFAVAFLIPNLLRRLFAEHSMTVAFIPTFEGYLTKEEGAADKEALEAAQDETKAFLSAIFTLITFLTTILVVVGILLTPIIIDKLFPDSAENFSLTVLLTRIMFPYLALISIASFFQGILNGIKIFSPSGFTPILFNIFIIALTYILTPLTDNPAIAMSIGVTVGGTVQALFQLPFILRTRFRFSLVSLKKSFTNSGTKKVIALTIPTLFGMAAYQLNDLVCSSLAKGAGVGVLSSLQYSVRLQELLMGVFAVSVGTVILPDMSGHASNKNWEKFEKVFIAAIKAICVVTIPATFFSLLSGSHIITLVYKAKHFDNDSVTLTMSVFQFHILGLFFLALNRVIAPAFYAQGNSKLPTLAGIIAFGANVVFSLLLVGPMSGRGLALALTLSSMVNTAFLFIFLHTNQQLNIKKIIIETIRSACKLILFSCIATLPCYFFGNKLYAIFAGHNKIISEGIPLFLNFCIFAVIGIALLVISGDSFTKSIRDKLKKRR